MSTKLTGPQMLAYIRNNFKRTDKDTEIYEALTDVIMEMRNLFLSEDHKEEAYTSSINNLGEFKLAVPSDFGHIIGDITVYDDNAGDSWVIRKITKETYDELYHDRHFTDTTKVNKVRPKHFCVYGRQIFIGPVPDSISYVYQLNYTTEAATNIDATTTEVPFSDFYRRYIRFGVLSELYYGMDHDDDGAKWESKFLRGMQSLSENDNFNSDAVECVQYRGI